MATGTVKWFNNAKKGFGFICPEGEEEVIFSLTTRQFKWMGIER